MGRGKRRERERGKGGRHLQSNDKGKLRFSARERKENMSKEKRRDHYTQCSHLVILPLLSSFLVVLRKIRNAIDQHRAHPPSPPSSFPSQHSSRLSITCHPRSQKDFSLFACFSRQSDYKGIPFYSIERSFSSSLLAGVAINLSFFLACGGVKEGTLSSLSFPLPFSQQQERRLKHGRYGLLHSTYNCKKSVPQLHPFTQAMYCTYYSTSIM